MASKNYSHLSLIYPYIMRSIDYVKWSNYIYSISKQLRKKNLYALELAGGNGAIANKIFTKFGHFCISDLSMYMLRSAGNNLDKVCCNMTELPFKQKYDFVFSTFDSINYLMSRQKILSLLKEVDLCLKPDGIFTFDVSLENNSKLYQKYLNRKGSVDSIKYVQKSIYDEVERIHYNYFEIILANGKKVEEIHKQKIYPFEDYFTFIDKSNFYVYKCKESFTDIDAVTESERVQFILKKKRNKC
ncbi:MAG: methyltransferase domain-containing protein [Bacteroidota bacterium]